MRVTIAWERDPSPWRLEDQEALQQWLEREGRLEQLEVWVSLVFVSDETIARLNEEHLGHEGATDVLAFDLVEESGEEWPFPGERELEESSDGSFPGGEVYVSYQRALEQASEYRVTPAEELGRLGLHGLLHLAGWCDGSAEERRTMREREDAGLARARKERDLVPWRFRRINREEEA